MTPKTRPKHLDLLKIRLPLPGLVSILHRASGLLLFLSLPVLLLLLEMSLKSPEDFYAIRAAAAQLPSRFLLLVFAWAASHHFFSGIRHLLLDIHVGVSLRAARASSKLVLGASLLATFLFGVNLW